MDRKKIIIKTSIVGILANVFLSIMKYIIGLTTNSIAITSDAINNLSDALSSVITIIGVKLAGRAPDKEHPLGYGRIEYMSGLIISFIVLYAGITTLIEAIKKIIHPEVPEFSLLPIIILVVGVAIKLLVGLYTQKKGKQVNSQSLIASGKDALNDSVISISVILSAIIYMLFKLNIESYVSIIISFFIIKSGVELVSESINKILGTRISHTLSQQVKESINKDPDVYGTYDLFLNDYGPDYYIGSVHVEVKDTMNAAEIDTMTRRIQKNIYETENVILSAIGIYSHNTQNEEVKVIENTVETIVHKHKEVIQFHGFYIDEKTKEMSFDIIIDLKTKNKDEIYQDILTTVQKQYPQYSINVTLDDDLSD